MIKKIFSLLARNIRIPLRYVKKFFLSVINYFSKPKKILNKNHLNLLVISPGGVATTTLIKYLKLYKKVNDVNDSDGFKHLSKYPIIEKKNLKIIYIYGSHEKIYNSLKRRNIFHTQLVKLGCPLCYLFWGSIEKFFFKLCVNRQINNFKNKKNVYVLYFDNIWNKKNDLKKYLKIDSDKFVKNFPSKN